MAEGSFDHVALHYIAVGNVEVLGTSAGATHLGLQPLDKSTAASSNDSTARRSASQVGEPNLTTWLNQTESQLMALLLAFPRAYEPLRSAGFSSSHHAQSVKR
jgi:hypothetical protein